MTTVGERASRFFGRKRAGFPSERQLLEALRSGDEAVFSAFVEEQSPALLRMAMIYVPSRAVAEEVVQETWLGVLTGLDRFEGRSTLKTWIFRILVNIARTRGKREARSIPFSSAGPIDPEQPSVDPDRFLPADHPERPNGWSLGPTSWQTPDESLLAGETRELILAAISKLPPTQREVITLRDLEGWSSEEVCNGLEISETNQRVLLHRARSSVRRALERYFGAMEPTV